MLTTVCSKQGPLVLSRGQEIFQVKKKNGQKVLKTLLNKHQKEVHGQDFRGTENTERDFQLETHKTLFYLFIEKFSYIYIVSLRHGLVLYV